MTGTRNPGQGYWYVDFYERGKFEIVYAFVDENFNEFVRMGKAGSYPIDGGRAFWPVPEFVPPTESSPAKPETPH